MTLFAEIKIIYDFFFFKDIFFSILKFVRLATHEDSRRLLQLLIVGLVSSSMPLLFLLPLSLPVSIA